MKPNMSSVFPANEAQQARASFSRASEILSERRISAPLKFSIEAADVRRMAEDLAKMLESGSALGDIDVRAVKLGAFLLEIQQKTLRARKNQR